MPVLVPPQLPSAVAGTVTPVAGAAPRSPARRAAALGALASIAGWVSGCGGGGGGDAQAEGGDASGGGTTSGAGGGGSSVPSISSFTLSPTSVTAGAAPVTIVGSLSFVDAGRDLATLTLEVVDPAGARVATGTVPVGAAAGLASGTLNGSVVATLPAPGSHRVRASVRDAAGNVSNVLEGALRVFAPPWTARAPMPTPREGFSLAQVGGRVYAIGGLPADAPGTPRPASRVLEAWDPATDRWTALAPMGSARADAAVAVVDGRILVFGGSGGAGGPVELAGVEAYDPATDTWSPRAPLPSARAGASAAVRGSRVSVLGGSAGGVELADHAVYDALADAWTPGGDVPLPSARRFPAAFTLLNAGQPVLQSIGGYASTETQNAGYLARWERLGTGAAAWTALQAPPTARERAAVVDAVPALYVIGGRNVERALATVEAWDLTTLSWRTRTPLPAPAATPGAALLADGRIVVVDARATWTYVPADDLA